MASVPCRVVRIPGPQGPAGADGTNGTNGYATYSLVAANFSIPAQQATVDATLTDPPGNRWMVPGEIGAVQGAGAAGVAGYYQIVSLTGDTGATLLNLRDDTTGAYADNLDGTGTVTIGLKIGPAGAQGPEGIAGTPGGGAPSNATYIVQTANGTLTAEQVLSVLATGFVFNTTGTGVLSVVPSGVGDLEVATNFGALVAGRAVFANAAGLQTLDAATARTNLGLGTMAVQNSNNVNITGGVISGVTLPGPTSLFPKDYLLYNYQVASGANGGSFAAGSFITMPLNTEVADTGNFGVLAANAVTLQPGTYRAFWKVCGFQVGGFISRLYNVTSATPLGYGNNAVADATDASTDCSEGQCRFTLAVAQAIRVEARCDTGNLVTGFGTPNIFGISEVYGSLQLDREAS